MELILAENLSNRSYILSGKRAFFYRFCDTGFKNKWTGLWAMPHKFLEYYALVVNDHWLSPDNCKSFNCSETFSSHQFNLGDLDVKELLFIGDTKSLVCILTFQNLSLDKKNVKVGLELAVNIREREENWHDRTYKVKVIEDKILINSEKGSLVLGTFPSGKLESSQEYREHHPSGEKQRCFIPGMYFIDLILNAKSKEDVFFIFSCGNNESEAIANYENTTKSLLSSYIEKERENIELVSNAKLDSGIEPIDNLFRWSVISLEKLAFNSDHGFGYFAGYPWFTQFWGRDLGWMLPAVIDYGNFEATREALRTLAKFQSEGNIPNTIHMNGNVDYNSIDATLLWIIVLNYYVKNSGDTLFLNEMKDSLIKAVEWCRQRDKDRDGFIEAEEKETWMDTLDRTGKPIEVQAFLIEALKSAGYLFKLLGDSKRARAIREQANKTEKIFEGEFWNKKEKFYLDRLNDKTKTINSIFPLIFGISQNPEKVLDRIESEEFTSKFGVRTISKNEEIFSPPGYHTGSAWGWITALAACAEFKNRRVEKAFEYLEMLNKNLNRNCIGAIEEAWNSETNESTLIKGNMWEEGCCLQGWSSALVIRAVDEFMLGIKINALDNTIIVSPSLLDGMKIVRRKRIGNDFVDITFDRIGNRLKVKYKSRKGKVYKLVQAPKV